MSLVMQALLPEGLLMMHGQEFKGRSSFSGHFEQKLNEVLAAKSDKLGVRPQSRDPISENDGQLASLLKSADRELTENETAAAILHFFLQDMQALAGKNGMEPGDWEVSITDEKALERLVLEAGMDEGQLGMILNQLEEGSDTLSVTSVLDILDRHLAAFEESRITVPETRLPFLETLLSKMGLDSTRIQEIAAGALTGDNKVDLAKFLEGLRGLDLEQGVLSPQKQEGSALKLSEWETRQLFDLLAEAGVDRSLRNKLLPELNLKSLLNQSQGENGAPGGPFSLDRFKAILQAGLENVENKQAEINIPRFMINLEKVLGQADFEKKSTGWTNVVQNAVDNLFKEVRKMIEMAQVKNEAVGKNDEELLLSGLLRQSGEKGSIYRSKWFSSFYDRKEVVAEKLTGIVHGSGGGEQKPDFWTELLAAAPGNDQLLQAGSGDGDTLFAGQSVKADSQSPIPLFQNSRIIFRSPQQLQEQVMQQISSGVMRGLDNRQHTLLLRLHPPEMGEVKINLQIRNDHVSVTFNMENLRVKDILEGNMQNFKDSMAQKGFSLDECAVFVGQEGTSGEKGGFRDFLQAGKTLEGNGVGEEEPIPLVVNSMGGGGPGIGNRLDGISLIV